MYNNQKVLCCSKHHKYQAFQPAFQMRLSTSVHEEHSFDTDTLGTFSIEVERKLSPKDAVIEKIHQALAHQSSDYSLAVATEASFGEHPTVPMLPLHHETIAFYDTKKDKHLIFTQSTVDTNYYKNTIGSEDELIKLCKQFESSQASLILSTQDPGHSVYKNIETMNDALEAYHALKAEAPFNRVLVQTDMRAMKNPLRMSFISELADMLAERLATPCPSCHEYGFGEHEVVYGQPCSDCSAPTPNKYGSRITCTECSYVDEQIDDSLSSPYYCSVCNP